MPTPDIQPATHVHIENTARDCDGTYERTHIEEGDLGDVFRWFHLPVTADETDATVSLTANADGMWILTVAAPTEEGYTSTIFTECNYDCDIEDRSQRDHTAEAAGY